MESEEYIISLTSYPARINCAVIAIKSLLNQKTEYDYRVVLVLADTQFPDRVIPKELVDLEKEGKLEIIWHPTDIRSHKKLIPTLMKYPDATIIITDDDVKRPDYWLNSFIKSHIEYPNDVIVGFSALKLGKDLKQTSANSKCTKGFSYKCITEPNKILITERPANGLGGVLYPKNTFTRKEFFDEKLFMTLSPNSDESWQYCFNVIEGKTLRMVGKIVNWSNYIIKGSQVNSLSKKNNGNEYTRLYNVLMKTFPEFKENMFKRLGLSQDNKIQNPIVICRLSGRLGNILFQIATSRYYATTNGMDIVYYFINENNSDYKYFKKANINSILNEPINILTKEKALSLNKLPTVIEKEISSITYSKIPYYQGKNIHIIGNRQSEKYFKKDFAINMFNFSDIDKIIERLYGNLSELTAIHIRRTDYIYPKRHYRSITEEDVNLIVEKFPENKYIIFSDDIEWCKEKFKKYDFIYPPKNDSNYDDSLIEFAAIRNCKNKIISNSTFAWWASYTSDNNGITVYKKPWFIKNLVEDIIPNDKNWVTFNNFIGIKEKDNNISHIQNKKRKISVTNFYDM